MKARYFQFWYTQNREVQQDICIAQDAKAFADLIREDTTISSGWYKPVGEAALVVFVKKRNEPIYTGLL